MATLDDLVPLIYHERQQEGSMLCAQHALNALLQGNYFTAPDLSEHARQLDSLEMSYDEDNTGSTSMNMDDTGFFSVQVLDRAVDVWNLTLTRWRSQEMQPYQDQPHSQIAFIFNQNQHWYTLRRFGDLTPGSTSGHWFDLNSFHEVPQWVSMLYLGMFIQQAEGEGYSVFVVRQKNPDAAISMPQTDADAFASAVPDNASAPRAQAGRLPGSDAHGKSAFGQIEGLEDEDMELQAALQASLRGDHHQFPETYDTPGPAASSFPSYSAPHGLRDEDDDVWDEDDMRAVAAPAGSSTAETELQQMQREQRMAHQELLAAGGGRPDPQYEEEEEMMRRIIAESEAMAREQGHQMSEDNGSHTPAPRAPPSASSAPRVYDDEDAELQAALKASMEGLPEGWTPPPDLEARTPAPPAPAPAAPTQASSHLVPPSGEDDELSESSFEAASDAPESAPAPSVDEIRRMRLARFGS